jgi:rubrerythrin/rhodanese-related sulfurtransferase
MDNLEFESLTAEELKKYVDTHSEKSYLLIDVRQPAEYAEDHIPGAKLMPLSEVETNLFTLPPDRDLIFYCTNGGRSQWAASLAGDREVCEKNVYHLMDGLRAWEGKKLSGYPKVRIFDKDQNFEQLLSTAMDLEKGAWRFYDYTSEKFRDEPIRPLLEQISIAEKAHARLIYRILKKFKKNPSPFELMYQRLEGEILEGGQTFEDTCRRLESIENHRCLRIIDLALTIEYTAFDLYRQMAERTEDTDARTVFLSLAQTEKAHMQTLTRAIVECP